MAEGKAIYKQEQCMKNQPSYMPVNDVIKNIKSVCKIETETSYGTGFLAELPVAGSSFVTGLLTCHHVLGDDKVSQGKVIETNFSGEHAQIRCGSFLVLSPEYDVTFIAIPSGEAKIYKERGLVFPGIECRVRQGDTVCVLEHPRGGDLNFCMGLVNDVEEHRIIHNVATDEGASGSPIFNKSSMVVGIHQASKWDPEGNMQGNAGCKMEVVRNLIEQAVMNGDPDRKYLYSTSLRQEASAPASIPMFFAAPSIPPQQQIRKYNFVNHCEVRSNNNWNEAANEIMRELTNIGVQKGQIISIDAHNNGNGNEAIFSAHFDKSLPSKGPLNIHYEDINDSCSWKEFYQRAAKISSHIKHDGLYSITASCNCKDRSVMYIFYDASCYDPDKIYAEINFCEVRGNTWNSAAQGILNKLRSNGVKTSQIISIDAHNNGPEEEAIFSAFWNPQIQDNGFPSLQHNSMNSGDAWESFYNYADFRASQAQHHVAAITSSINTTHKSVTYVFFA